MYELKENQLLLVDKVITPNQTAIVKTYIEIVGGNTNNKIKQFENMPSKEDIEGKKQKLMFNNDTEELYWLQEDAPMTSEQYIAELENQLLLMADSLSGGIL